MLVRRLARPMLASWYVHDGLDAVRTPAPHVAVARPVADRVTSALGRAPLPDRTLAWAVRAHGAATILAGAGLALGRAPRSSAATLALLTLPLVVAQQPLTSGRTVDRERVAPFVHALGGLGASGGVEDGRPVGVHLSPVTDDEEVAMTWFRDFEGAGLDGLIAKDPDAPYQPGKRVLTKLKHERTADCVVAGYRTHKNDDEAIGSLLLGLWTEDGALASVGVTSSFPMKRRRELFVELQGLVTDLDGHPWDWARHLAGERTPRKSEQSRWAAGKDLSFVPLRPERVVEVRYDYLEGERFRHTTQFVRWRPDRDPRSCTYDQLERPAEFDLAEVLGVGR